MGQSNPPEATSGDEKQRLKREQIESHAAVLAGLTSGAMITTGNGEVPVEWLETGDEVLTRDRGLVPVVWLNRVKLTRADFRIVPEFAPVTIAPGRFDGGTAPSSEMVVSPRQLIMLRSPLAERDYWSSEVLVPARALGQQADPGKMHRSLRVVYTQVMLATHETIMIDGAWCGSLFTGNHGVDLAHLNCPLVAKLDQPRMMSTRPILSFDEARALVAEIDAFEADQQEPLVDRAAGD